MTEALANLFSVFCGQDPGHTWTLGGVTLPCCQRCTGLYAGALAAALLHLLQVTRIFNLPYRRIAFCKITNGNRLVTSSPTRGHRLLTSSPTGKFLWVHGAFLLLMVPFGYHWVPQGPVLRVLTGALFAFGVVTFLTLPLSQLSFSSRITHRASSPLPYFTGVALTLVVLPLLARWESAFAGWVLSFWCAAGLLALSALVLADAAVGLAALVRFLVRLRQTGVQA